MHVAKTSGEHKKNENGEKKTKEKEANPTQKVWNKPNQANKNNSKSNSKNKNFLSSLQLPKEKAQEHAVFLSDSGDIYWITHSKGTAT